MYFYDLRQQKANKIKFVFVLLSDKWIESSLLIAWARWFRLCGLIYAQLLDNNNRTVFFLANNDERETVLIHGYLNSFTLPFSKEKRTIESIDGFQLCTRTCVCAYIKYYICIFVYICLLLSPAVCCGSWQFWQRNKLTIAFSTISVYGIGYFQQISSNTHILNIILIGTLTAQSAAIRLSVLIAKTIK